MSPKLIINKNQSKRSCLSNKVIIAGAPFKKIFTKNHSIYQNGKVYINQDQNDNDEFRGGENKKGNHVRQGGHGKHGHGKLIKK